MPLVSLNPLAIRYRQDQIKRHRLICVVGSFLKLPQLSRRADLLCRLQRHYQCLA